MNVHTRKPASHEGIHDGIWDDQHVKALLRFARSPIGLIQQNPWHTWIGQRGGLNAIYAYLAEYPFASAQRRLIEVVLRTPEAVADVYADTLHMSRATFFNHLPGAMAAVGQALNQWKLADAPTALEMASGRLSGRLSGHSSGRFSLPNPLTALVGVDDRVATLEAMLERRDVRLLVLLGPGGIGKSRLAIALAQRHAAPTCFVDLASVVCAEAAPAAVAAALGIENGAPETIKRALSGDDFLLVFDNIEQILEAQSMASELLLACPSLKIIVTSRVALHAYGEYEYVVPPLKTSCGEIASQTLSPAAELFVARAQTVRPTFCASAENRAVIEMICALLAGNPLAIELAAFQMKYHAPRTILDRLEHDAVGFLGKEIKGMPAHQRGIAATLDWSYNLLAPDAQHQLLALAALPDRFTFEDAERLVPGAGEGVMTLVDHSLLQQEHCANGQVYFEMPALVRAYAQGLQSPHALPS